MAVRSPLSTVDVGVENMEKRLGPLFEYLRMRHEQEGEHENDDDVIDAVVSCGREALKAARGGFHDAKALVFDAFFFAWVSHAPSVGVTPGDPFAARSLWRLSLKQFEAAVEKLELMRELRSPLRDSLRVMNQTMRTRSCLNGHRTNLIYTPYETVKIQEHRRMSRRMISMLSWNQFGKPREKTYLLARTWRGRRYCARSGTRNRG
jgi:hypothetical protein